MKRLTYYNMKGSENDGYYLKPGVTIAEAIDRLAAYEAAGLTPEEIVTMQERLNENIGAAKMWRRKYHDLLQAENEGRLLVLPCRVGDTVWRIKRTFEFWPDKSTPYVEADAFLLQDIYNFGKTVFLTREEAEAALKGEGNAD